MKNNKIGNPAGRARREPFWNENCLETDGRNPVAEGNPHISEFHRNGITEFEESPVEKGCDATESGLVEELTHSQESVEEFVDSRDGLRQFRPEITGDDVQHDCDNDTANDATGKTARETVEPFENGRAHLLELVLGDHLLRRQFGVCGMQNLADRSVVVLLGFLVVCCDSSLRDCGFVFNVLVFHVDTPLVLKNVYGLFMSWPQLRLLKGDKCI